MRHGDRAVELSTTHLGGEPEVKVHSPRLHGSSFWRSRTCKCGTILFCIGLLTLVIGLLPNSRTATMSLRWAGRVVQDLYAAPDLSEAVVAAWPQPKLRAALSCMKG